jgi:hypothetical protein
VGNFPAVKRTQDRWSTSDRSKRTLGKTGTEETRNLLDKSFRGQESIVLLSEFFDELLVLVKPAGGSGRS